MRRLGSTSQASATETTVPSAATTNLNSSINRNVVITGTTTITSFGNGQNLEFLLRFTGALILTHNATSLILPGAVNITTQPGDTCLVTSDGSGNWRVRAYQPADGGPIIYPITVADGGTGSNTAAGARTNLGAAASGNNADITALNSPALNSATATTQATGDNSTKVATTAFFFNQAAQSTPLMDGTGAIGSSALFARQDHVHPSDTTRAPTTRGLAAGSGLAGGGDLSADRTFSIATGGVVNAMLATAATNTIKGNVSGVTASPVDLTVNQVRALLGLNSTGAVSRRNRLVNGDFSINQRAVASASTSYAAGVYTVDRWKAGANGCTLSFSTAANGDVTISITAGTLLQIIEGPRYLDEGGSYILSWSGSATARVYQGTATGSYAASPVQANSLTAGTNTTVEYSTGTLTLAQFEPGTIATIFERRDDEMERCRRYFYYATFAAQLFYAGALAGTTTATLGFWFDWKISAMRIAPTVTVTGGTSGTFASGFPKASLSTIDGAFLRFDTTATGTSAWMLTLKADAEL